MSTSIGSNSNFIRRTGRIHQPTKRYGFDRRQEGDSEGDVSMAGASDSGKNHRNSESPNNAGKNTKGKRNRKKISKTQNDDVNDLDERSKKYSDIQYWTHDQWSIVLGFKSPDVLPQNGTENSTLNNLPIDIVPSQVKRRFGLLCFVRRSVEFLNTSKLPNSSLVKEHWFPALELNPLHVRGHSKHRLRRDWLLAIDELRELLGLDGEITEARDERGNGSIESNTDDSDNAHLVYYLGVTLGEDGNSSRNRTREPFALVKGSDYMSVEDGFMHGYTELPQFLQDKVSRLENGSINTLDDLLEPWEVELLVGLGTFFEKVQEYDCNEAVKFIAEEYVSDDIADEVSSYGSHPDNTDDYSNSNNIPIATSQKSSNVPDTLLSASADNNQLLRENEYKPSPTKSGYAPSTIKSRSLLPDVTSSNNSSNELLVRNPPQRLKDLEEDYGIDVPAKGLSSRTSALEILLFDSEQKQKVLTDRISRLEEKRAEHANKLSSLCVELGIEYCSDVSIRKIMVEVENGAGATVDETQTIEVRIERVRELVCG